jgi:signal transduction histidine kinase
VNRNEAIDALTDDSATTRLRAARSLLESALSEDLDIVVASRARESDSWTQRVLDRVIAKLDAGSLLPDFPAESMAAQEGVPAVQAQALQIATKRLLHEVRPVVQSIGRAAKRDVGEAYGTSAIRIELIRMGDLLEALQDLGEAAQSPRVTQFDLSEVISSQVKSEGLLKHVILGRSDPVLVEGDPTLVSLAFANLIRNAVEASVSASVQVVVNWARNDSQAWIAVLDEGEGLPPDGLAAALEIGTTSRSDAGHFGLGLPTAMQAMKSMGGTIALRPRKEGGTAAEARWPQ